MPRDPRVIDVRVLNSENNTYYYFTARQDRLEAFYQFVVTDRRIQSGPWMPGLSGQAIYGVQSIFCGCPARFPSLDILTWFRNEQKTYLGTYPNPTIGIPEIEDALGRFATTVFQLHQDGSGEEIKVEAGPDYSDTVNDYEVRGMRDHDIGIGGPK